MYGGMPRRSVIPVMAMVMVVATVAGSTGDARAAEWGETYHLANGLRVILSPDVRFPSVTVLVRYHVGARHEPPGRSGIAHLVEHLTFRVPRPPVRAFSYAAQFTVSSGNGGTTYEHTEYYTTAPSGNLKYALWSERWRMGIQLRNITESDRKHELEVVKNERRQRVEIVPYRAGRHRLWETLFPGTHPFREEVIGSMTDLAAISLDEARAFYEAQYNARNATLTVVGDFKPAEARAIIASYYGPLQGRPPPPPPAAEPARPQEKVVIQHDEIYGKTPRLHIAWHTPPAHHPDHAAGELAALVIAGLNRSRVRAVAPEVVRASAYQESLLTGSVFHLFAEPKAGVPLDEVEAKVDRILAGLAERPPTDQEMDNALRAALRGMFLRMEDSLSKAIFLTDVITQAKVTEDPLVHERGRFAAVTAEQVRAFVASHLGAQNRVVVHYVPRAP